MGIPGSPPSTHFAPLGRFSRVPTVDIKKQALCDSIKSTNSATSTLLKDTKWPRESNDTAQNLLQIIHAMPDLPTEALLLENDAEQVLSAVHAKVKKASEKYGMRERGFRDGIKHFIASLHASKCADILRTCREDIDRVSTMRRICLESTKGTDRGSEVPASPQAQENIPLVKSESRVGSPKPPLGSQPKPDNPTSHRVSVPDDSVDIPQSQQNRNLISEGAITAARKTFQTVETLSGAIPGVGDFVGVAAKVGLAFVNMIETMDKNEDISKELTHHTSKLSTYLDHFRKNLDAEKGGELVTQVENISKELEDVREKVNQWNSSGRLKKAFLSGDHAEGLKGYQDTVQTALEEIQLLVGLKTSDVVVELKNAELRAERRRLLACLGDGSYGARGNSIEDVVCLPGTRVEILERIDQWIKDTSDSAERVLWIRGMAGRGKSTIASTVAHNWASRGSCAIFHFRRGQNALDGQFVCALARQLGKSFVTVVKNAILECVKKNEDIAQERLDQQFKTLFVGSLKKLRDHAHPVIIVVDALDECKNVTDAVRFVRLIDQHSSLLHSRVKFLITCRPEAPLLVALEPRKWHAEDLDSISHVTEDITRFIQNACAQIRDEHDLPDTWPSSTDLKSIVEMSQGVFQWARTALTYISDRSPEHRLQELLQDSSTWSGMDDLYHQILLKAFNEVETNSLRRELLSWVLGTLVVAPYPVSLEVIAFLHADHAIFRNQNNIIQFLRKDILADLNSLVHISTSVSEPVRLMHTSIRDLLLARGRCGHQRYFIDPTEDHRRLAGMTLQIMGRNLRQNICNLPNILMANREIQDIVDDHVSKGLRYCCRSWSIHLTAGATGSETTAEATMFVLEKFRVFSDEKLLFWLEVMSLIGATTEASLVAKQVYEWLLEWPGEMSNGLLISLWNDIRRLIAAFIEPISFGALHIYASALPQCPVGTKLWAKYRDQATTRIVLGKRHLDWQKNIWTSSAGSDVKVVTFSPNGSLLASGSDSGIHFWDAQTGALLGGPLVGHSGWIISIAFSPDGKVLASGSGDKTVRLWNVQAGEPRGDPLTGHNDLISSVAFSPNGKILASGSYDRTIRLWDPQTGAPLGDPLTGYEGVIRSVVFASDNMVLASFLDEQTVRLWDAQTGAPLGDPLVGHSDWIICIAFSPDGKVLASGSGDMTVRLWDAQTGKPVGDPLAGHSGYISSVAFSPNGKILASGSTDRTIRLWDPQTGVPLGDPLTFDSFTINSVALSPDGKVLASGLGDKTIRLWDAQNEASLGNPHTGHGGGTGDFSSSTGRVLTSESYDETVRLWDAQTGAPLGDPPTGHSSHIESVVFSPNGTVLASWSQEWTVQLWDAQTGAPLGDPLTGNNYWDSCGTISPYRKVSALRLNPNMARVLDVQTGARLGEPGAGYNYWESYITFSPDSKVLASRLDRKTVRLSDAQTGAPLGDPLTSHNYWDGRVTFSPDSKVLASRLDHDTVRVWDAQTGVPLSDPLTCDSSDPISLVFSPNGKVLAFRLDQKTLRLWSLQTGAPLCDPLIGHNDRVVSIAFSPDGKVLASGSYDKTVRLWDVETGAPLGDLLAGSDSVVRSVVFAPDGMVLASLLDENTVRFWDAQTRVPLGDLLTDHSDRINSIAFSSDSKVLASSFDFEKDRLWDAQTRAPLGDPQLTSHHHGLAVPLRDPLLRGSLIGSVSRPIEYWGRRRTATVFPFQSVAVSSGEVLSILDVSRSLNL